MTVKIITNILATTICSISDAWFLNLFQISMVKIVVAELKIDVKEDINAAIITDIINPARPGYK